MNQQQTRYVLMKNIKEKWQSLFNKSEIKKSTQVKEKEDILCNKGDIFETAKSWSYDMYTSELVSKNRYQYAFFAAIGLVGLLIIGLVSLSLKKDTKPYLVNHYQDGRITVEPLRNIKKLESTALIQGELVRYVINRESYDPASYQHQFSLITQMSNDAVTQGYLSSQSSSNKHSPISVLGAKGYRTVHVDSVIFLDRANKNKQDKNPHKHHQNLAQVNFTVKDHHRHSSLTQQKSYSVLISWVHQGMPQDPESMWSNWDGFTVTRYTKEQRNI
jgi:type IV secretion system protein VirB8